MTIRNRLRAVLHDTSLQRMEAQLEALAVTFTASASSWASIRCSEVSWSTARSRLRIVIEASVEAGYHAAVREPAGYADPDYARSLTHVGEARPLARTRGSLLVRAID